MTVVAISSGGNLVVTDTIGAAVKEKNYPLSKVSSSYVALASGAKYLSLIYQGQMIVTLPNTAGWEGFGNSIFGSTDPDVARVSARTILGTGGSGSVTVGDCKSGLQSIDHGGWLLLDGRLKSTLTATQQAAATSLGVGTNLPDATGRAFVQGIRGAQIGSSTITQANLPSVNLLGGNHAHGVTDSGHTHQTQQANNGTFNSNGAAGAPVGFGNSFTTSLGYTGVSIQASGTLSIPLGGSGVAYTPAAIGVNQFIFLGV